MKKYFTIFKIGWQNEMEYRLNLLLGRLRSITTFVLLYYIWHSLAASSGKFAGFTWPELITYIFGVNILRSVIFGAQSRLVAQEITSGSFSMYLVKPVNHLLFTFARELSQRSLYFVFLGMIIVLGLHIITASICMRTMESDNVIWLYREAMTLGRFPPEIFSPFIQALFTFVFPIIVIVAFPTKILLGTLSWYWMLYAGLYTVLFIVFSLWLWQNSLKHYASASS
jgi:ABC-2 type transport system permease protein